MVSKFHGFKVELRHAESTPCIASKSKP
jgi:hypothetical protein